MSTRSFIRPAGLLNCLTAVTALLTAAHSSAALNVTPSSISNGFHGTIDLAITGLNAVGQTVVIEKFFDSDADSTITGNDLLVQRVKVTDGQVTSIGGQRNLNVPGDEDGSANSAILARLRTTTAFTADRLAGRFIFRIAPDGAGFAPFTGTLAVTQADHGGSGISGRITGAGMPQARAIVLFTSGPTGDFNVTGATVTDAAGNYSLKLPAGTYRPVPSKSSFTFDLTTGPSVTVNAGAFAASPDAVMAAATRTISGTVRDEAPPFTPLPGALVFGQSEAGVFAITFSGSAGDYLFPADAGVWELGLLEWPLAQLGMLQGGELSEGSAGNVTGFHLGAPRATALIYGTVRTPASVAVPYFGVEAESDGGPPERRAAGVTDVNGNYTLGTVAGNWRVGAETPGYLVPEAHVLVPAPATAVLLPMIATPLTAHLRGQVRDNHNNPVPNIELIAHDYQNTNSWGITDADGFFDLGVHGGSGGSEKTWALQLNEGGDGGMDYISTSAEFQVTDGTDINNITYTVLGITARLRGNLRLNGGNPPPNTYQLYASAQNFSANSGSDVDGSGAFDIPVLAGNWQVGLSGQPSGIIWQNNLALTVADGVDQNGLTFHLRTASRSISGTLKNSGGSGIGGVTVMATITDGGVGYTTFTISNPDGSYELPAFAGTWSVSPNGDDLNNQGYQPVGAQSANTSAGNATINFTATTGGGSPYNSWRTSFFTPAELADPDISGPAADPDHDGIGNLLEYAFNLRPKVSEPASLPQVGYQPPEGPATAFLTLTFTRLTGNPGIAYNAQEAPDTAGSWTGVAASYEVIASNGITETVRAKTPIGPGKKFLRLEVVLTSP